MEEKEGEEEEDEVPSLPLGVTGNVCSLFLCLCKQPRCFARRVMQLM